MHHYFLGVLFINAFQVYLLIGTVRYDLGRLFSFGTPVDSSRSKKEVYIGDASSLNNGYQYPKGGCKRMRIIGCYQQSSGIPCQGHYGVRINVAVFVMSPQYCPFFIARDVGNHLEECCGLSFSAGTKKHDNISLLLVADYVKASADVTNNHTPGHDI